MYQLLYVFATNHKEKFQAHGRNRKQIPQVILCPPAPQPPPHIYTKNS